jgi:hypothetical protein
MDERAIDTGAVRSLMPSFQFTVSGLVSFELPVLGIGEDRNSGFARWNDEASPKGFPDRIRGPAADGA